MRVLCERCAGLDVHQRTVVACVSVPDGRGDWQRTVRTFRTTTAALGDLAAWLTEAGVTHVAMESTGVYWKPVYNVLEDRFVLLVVNAQHLKRVPGRKTDVKDAEWLAELLQHGLLTASFIPDRQQRQWRDLTRHRASLQQDRVRVKHRIHKTLQDANLKLSSVMSDVLGVSGRAMLRALVAGEADPARLATLADGRLKASRADLEAALTGRLLPHHRFVLGELLEQLAHLEAAIDRVSAEIARQTAAQAATIARLDTIPGINAHTAEVIVAEVGATVDRFPSARHLASWAGLCPGNDESGGVPRSGRTRRGNVWLRRVLFQAAHAAVKQRGSFLGALYRRWMGRLGAKKALVAVAHRLLVIVYCLLARQDVYRERDLAAPDQRRQQRQEQHWIAHLTQRGYTVSRPATAPVAV